MLFGFFLVPSSSILLEEIWVYLAFMFLFIFSLELDFHAWHPCIYFTRFLIPDVLAKFNFGLVKNSNFYGLKRFSIFSD